MPKPIPKQIYESVKDEYVNDYASVKYLSTKYSLHRSSIQKILKSYGVRLRTNSCVFPVDHKFFQEYNEKSCYWAGFIAADGYIRSNKRNTLHIKLKPSDVGHLEKLKSDMGFGGHVKLKRKYCYIDISSEYLLYDLKQNYNIINKKSLIYKFPKSIPKDMVRHFIRGYFDGDGSLSSTKSGFRSCYFLGTYDCTSCIRDYFFGMGVRLRSKDLPEILTLNNIYSVGYSGKSCVAVCNILYNDCSIYLDRKFKLAQQ